MNIFLIDDDQECLESLKSALSVHGFKVESYESPNKAIKAYDPENVDIVITDYHFPDIKAIEIISALKEKKTNVLVIVITGDGDKRIENLSLQAGAIAFYRKPLSIIKIVKKIKSISHQ